MPIGFDRLPALNTERLTAASSEDRGIAIFRRGLCHPACRLEMMLPAGLCLRRFR